MEISRRDLVTGLAATAAVGISPLGGEAFASGAEPAPSGKRHALILGGPPLVSPPPAGLRFRGPVAFEAAFGDGAAGFDALKEYLRVGSGKWMIVNEWGGDRLDAMRCGSGLYFEMVGPDGEPRPTRHDADYFAVRAFYLDEHRPMPSPDDLWRLTHAARFAALHAFRICASHGYRGETPLIEYRERGGLDDSVVHISPLDAYDRRRTLRAISGANLTLAGVSLRAGC